MEKLGSSAYRLILKMLAQGQSLQEIARLFNLYPYGCLTQFLNRGIEEAPHGRCLRCNTRQDA